MFLYTTDFDRQKGAYIPDVLQIRVPQPETRYRIQYRVRHHPGNPVGVKGKGFYQKCA
ncbi:MAG: hypothetical protein OXI23_21650 [Gemmatimonadota bacterium]|nr:hypothetical protein [Gemmatimonadota bacterium]